MMRKCVRLIALTMVMLVSTAFVFAGGASEKATTAESNEPIELVYWSHYGQSPAFVQAFADSVNLAAKNLGYTNVTCRAEVIEYSGYEAKYITGFSSNNGPDFFLGRPSDWALDGGRNPIALAFNDTTKNAWDSSLAAAFVNDGNFNGKRYGFPCEGGSLQMLYINTDAMKEIGLDPVKDLPKTLREMKELAIKLTKRDATGTITRSGFQPRYLGGGDGVSGKFIPYFHNFGARALAQDFSTAEGYINGERAVEALTWFKDMVTKTSKLDFGAPESAFQSGQAAIINREGWFAQDTINKAPNINFVCIPFPAGPYNDDFASTAGSGIWCNMISAKTKHAELCQKIMAELSKPIYDITLHEPAAYPPVCKDTMKMDNAYFGKQAYASAVLELVTKPGSPDYSPLAAWGPCASLFGDSLAKIIGTNTDIKTELDALAGRMNQILNQ